MIIKITYITELAMEGEFLSFVLPSSVAPNIKSIAQGQEETFDPTANVGLSIQVVYFNQLPNFIGWT